MGNTYHNSARGSSIATPEELSILFADNLYGQTTDEFKHPSKDEGNTLLWFLPPGCTDEVQPVDAGYGRLVKVHVGKALNVWLLNGDNVETWESNKLTSSGRILITQWAGEAGKQIDRDIRYRRRLFEKTWLAMTADGSDDNIINLEGVERGTYSFMGVDSTPEPLEDVLPISPAPADEDNPPGTDIAVWITDGENCPCLSGRVIMDSTRSIRVFLFIPLAKSVATPVSMLNECAINSHDECWKCCHLSNILLLGYKEMISHDKYSDEGWTPGKLLLKCNYRQ